MGKRITKYDKNGNLIYHKITSGLEFWRKYDKNNNEIYYKNSSDYEVWYKYDKNGKQIEITEKEYKNIEYNVKIREYNSRTKCSRFELIEI